MTQGVAAHCLGEHRATLVEASGATGVDAHTKSAAGGSRMGMAMLAVDIGVNAIAGGGEGNAALSRLMKDAAENPGAWRTIGAFTEAALNNGLKGGTSVQTISENQAGDRSVQLTLMDRSGNVVEQHYRPMYKPRDVDKP